MSSHKLPVVRHRIRLVSEHLDTRLNQAQLAQHHEENLGDLVQLTEMRSTRFESLHSMMSRLYSVTVVLYSQGSASHDVMVSISRRWDKLILEELSNRDLRTNLLVLEAHYNDLETSFSAQADHFELLLVTLLALHDELILRSRVTTSPTPLGDVDMG